MKITFLGTGAATAYPLPFCRCANCKQAWVLGGPSLRKRSSLLINEDLLIDLGPDIVTSAFEHGVSLSGIKYCLLTHPHSDHFDISHLFTRHPEYAGVDMSPLTLYASKGTLNGVVEQSRNESADADLSSPRYCRDMLHLEIHEIEAAHTVQVGRYQVTGFSANHDPNVEPLLYAIADGRTTVFYGTDTAAFPDRTWQQLRDVHISFDLLILDHTYGPGLARNDHLDDTQFHDHVSRMRDKGLLGERTRIFATHISHEGNPVHPELARYAAEHGYEVAYDGLVVHVN